MPASELLCGGPGQVTRSVIFRTYGHVQREDKILSENTLGGKGEDKIHYPHLRRFISKLKTELQVLIILILLRIFCVLGIVLTNIHPFEGGNIVVLGFEMRKEIQGY